MAKVIVERPRVGGGYRFPRGTFPDGTEMERWRRREGIRRAWRGNEKSLNENLAPLWRFLRSRIGRPWDKVYSEVCERINKNCAVQLHIWQHLMQAVCTNPYEISGEVNPRRFRWISFYVDPKTGLLREGKCRRRRDPLPPAPDSRIAIDDCSEYRRLDGIWYRLTLAPIPANGNFYDMALKESLTPLDASRLRKFYGRPVYAVQKRQLNKKEIRWLPIEKPA